MSGGVWKKSTKKYGVAIGNFSSSDISHALTLQVGETVHILEEYESSSGGWYRGSSLQNKQRGLGIFPAVLIHIKPCTVDNEGLLDYETVTPIEDHILKEVGYVLREWSVLWKTHYIQNQQLFQGILSTMQELVSLRSQLINSKLSQDEVKEVKKNIVGHIDWGNGQMGMDLVPRIDGEQVDADKCSITRLYRIHIDSAEVANSEKPQHKLRETSITRKKAESDVNMELGMNTHHILISFKHFGCCVGDQAETFLSLYYMKDYNCICLTEKFLVRHDVKGMPLDPDRLYNYFGLFTDLTSDDLQRELYLVAHIYRTGSMKVDKVRSKGTHYRRPWGVGVVSLTLSKLPSSIKDWEFPMKVQCYHDNESAFPTAHEQIIKRIQQGGQLTLTSGTSKQTGPGLSVSIKMLHGDIASVKKEDPMLFSKGVAVVQRLGFSEIITPGEVRNDLYVTLKCGEFERGSKKTNKNVEVKVTVFDASGVQIENCITNGCGEPPVSTYCSSVFYHWNKPEWNEIIKLSVPIQRFSGSHILFEMFHCTTRFTVRKREKERLGFSFVRVVDDARIVIKDDTHQLCVYKCEGKEKLDMKAYLKLPFKMAAASDAHSPTKVTGNQSFKVSDRESFTVSTLLCSGKFTQSEDLLGILNWRAEHHKKQVTKNLDKLCKMQGEEIVKFLNDILDKLFDMFECDSDTEVPYAQQIFMSLVHVFTLLHHARFENFKPVLEAYISDLFSATLIHRPLLHCFATGITNACQAKSNFKIIEVFQVMDYIMRFIVRSRELQKKNVFSRDSAGETEFHDNLKRVFNSMGTLLSSKSDRVKGYQMTLLSFLHMAYEPLFMVLTEVDLANLIVTALKEMPRAHEIPDDLSKAKLELLRKTVSTRLFQNDDSRRILLPMCLSQIRHCMMQKILMPLTINLFGDILDIIFNLKEMRNIQQDIQTVVESLFEVSMETILCSDEQSKGAVISCLTEMLRLMDQEHYLAVMKQYPSRNHQRIMLTKILLVFKELVKPSIFPMDWTVMRMVTNSVVFTAVEYFSSKLTEGYSNDSFDKVLWSNYFNLAVAFITQPSLQLDQYSEAKAQKIRERYQDMRVLMGIQVETLWHSLGHHKQHFIPMMVGPFLELTLVPEQEVRKATLPIIFDMLESDQQMNGTFRGVEVAVFDRLDYFFMEGKGDKHYADLFSTILLERVQSEPTLQENGPKFIISVTDLLERLLDYRQVMDGGEENRDKRMHCSFNILNFYKENINREEMYIRYVHKLYDLHIIANNYVEAGLTLQLYAKLLNWSEEMMPEELRYQQQPEFKRKEMIYHEIINCFDKGKVWEYGIPMCKDLAGFYEKRFEYKKLGDILRQQATFYDKILEGVTSDEGSEPYPRQDPAYYRVVYYGQSFPAFVRNKAFIYRGDECLRLATIINHLTTEFPSAQIIPNNSEQNEAIKEGDQQYIQICSVKPLPDDRPELRDGNVPTEIQNFYNVNEVSTFQFDRPYHRGEKDKENESKTLCIARTKLKTNYKFPGILRWYEIVEQEGETLCPIRVALEQTHEYNEEMKRLVDRCHTHPKLYFNNLEMRLQGVITAAVNGGITKFHEAFFTKSFEQEHPDEVRYRDHLQRLLETQLDIVKRGLNLHGKLVPEDLQPLHKNLEVAFKKMKKAVQEHGVSAKNRLSGSDSIRPGTPGSGSERSSVYSQDDEGVVSDEHLYYPVLPEKSRYMLSPQVGTDVPPPIPSRPHSMIVSKHTPAQTTSPVGLKAPRSDSGISLSKEGLSASMGNISSPGNQDPRRGSATQYKPPTVRYNRRPSELQAEPSEPAVSSYKDLKSKMAGVTGISEEWSTPPLVPPKTKSSISMNGLSARLSPLDPKPSVKSPARNEPPPPLPPRRSIVDTDLQPSKSSSEPRHNTESVSVNASLSETVPLTRATSMALPPKSYSNQTTQRQLSATALMTSPHSPQSANTASPVNHSYSSPPPIPSRSSVAPPPLPKLTTAVVKEDSEGDSDNTTDL